ncbi:MAG TPA: MFS transporter [Candidatus Dormibacteraeota bacterium]
MPSRTVPVYLAAGAFFAAIATRGFLVPLRANELGANRFLVGLLFTVATLAAALVALPGGFLADRMGRRLMLALSATLAGLSQLLLAASGSVPLYLLWQVVGGIGAGIAQAALFAALVDAVPDARRGRAFGWMTLSMQFGFLAGPALGGLLLGFVSLSVGLYVSSALYLVALGSVFWFGREHPREARSGRDFGRTLVEISRRPGFWPVVVGMLAATLVWGTTQAYLPVFGKQVLGLPGSAIGYLLALQAVANGLSRIPAGRIVDRVGRKAWIVAGGVGVYALTLLVLPHLTGFWWPALLLVATVPFLGTAFIAIGVVFSGLGGQGTQGTAMGVYTLVLFLGLAVGPVLFGPVMDLRGYTAGFSLCALVAISLTAAMLMLRAQDARLRRPALALPPASPGR